jgi:hypothetical protein
MLRSLPDWLAPGCPAVEIDSTPVVRLGASSKLAFKTSRPWSDDLDIPHFLRRRK